MKLNAQFPKMKKAPFRGRLTRSMIQKVSFAAAEARAKLANSGRTNPSAVLPTKKAKTT